LTSCFLVGDGFKDAPALKQADCGAAVSGATDAARSAAALFLMTRAFDHREHVHAVAPR
jgi:magnesium-transporting ATPase (P-type)